MTYSPRRVRQIISDRRRKIAPRPPPLDGYFLMDPDNGREVFVPFELLHEECKDAMRPENVKHFEDYGIFRWNKDPSYNWGKKK